MKRISKSTLRIKEGLFFPEDFKRFNAKTAIYIKSGCVIDLRKL